MKSVFFTLFIISFSTGYAFQIDQKQERYVALAAENIDNEPELARAYLDSISNPSEAKLKSLLGTYYFLRGKIADQDYDRTAFVLNFAKSLQYAEKYKEYKVAAQSSGYLASNFYLIKKDSLADTYLEKAKRYYTKIKDTSGLLDVMQFPAYAKYVNSEAEESISMVLEDLETYKNVENDQMYYSFAIFLLTSNYLHLGDIDKAHEYNSIYKSLEGNEYIEPYYYLTYNNSIKTCFVEYYFKYQNLDSVKYYLDGIYLKEGSKDINVQKQLYEDYIKYYRLTNNLEKEKIYLDSLGRFNKSLLEKASVSSVNLIEELSETQLVLNEESINKQKTRRYIYFLLAGIALLLVLLILYFKKIKKKEYQISDISSSFQNLRSKQEKLAVKNVELEEFLVSVRKDVKQIALMDSLNEQRKSINNLYKKIHLSQNDFVNSDDHLKVISSINEDFFLQAEKDFPQLDDLEVLICYYLLTGFKNKEIAMFTKRSLRAIESKRYRVAKKLGVDSSKETLKDFLNRKFNR
ncbi:helix-turn-helix transcriptional regulator [Patiriisocius hiemis]|uniref:HTH luxR-type domain-containing protein n=1 Tax=Patiriisocius hiemis TaxID=3075604 RepID=A0ABU2YGF9_9FLAO|nr:hypothetical protein [Constantimarinum sp. W242]MDT0556138.1 hypothetical protein [Constantimarinum sp. W242]